MLSQFAQYVKGSVSENFNAKISETIDESARRLVASALEPTLEINRAHRLRDVISLD